jgi:endonuclease G
MLIRLSDPSWEPTEVPDCHITSRLGNIVACVGSLRTIEALENDAKVIGVEASRPGSGFESSSSISFIRADKIHQLPEKGDQSLIAIIDDGIDVMHEAFLNSQGQTRILAIWDQTDDDMSGTGPKLPGATFSYGKEHTSADIDNYIQARSVPAPLGRNTDGHGTHVASIAAGSSGSPFSGGVAPEAKIIVVRPRLRVGPTDPFSIGYSNSHIDALTYIKQFAQQQNLPVVVNVSLGMNAGAHDGTSALEAAFDNFSGGGREPGYIIVKSAGNERGFGGHVKLSVATSNADTIEWFCQASNRGPDVIELWFKSCDEMDFKLKDPKGSSSRIVTRQNNTDFGSFSSKNTYAIFYERYHHDNGDSRLLITIKPGGAHHIQPGPWVLEITGRRIKSGGEIHGWMERNNSRPIKFTNHLNEEVTLSIPGTAKTVISVGSVDTSPHTKVAAYSSYGPTRDSRDKPELAAPGENISAAKGGTDNGVRSDSGTSMAAPHVTGAIALLFSHWEKQKSSAPNWVRLNAAQVRAAISQVTLNYNGRWYPGLGFGVLNTEALLSEFS